VIIICAYGCYAEAEAAAHKPQLVYVDRQNKVTHTKRSIPKQAA
jgi:aspartate 1-decarboxylase